MRPLGRPIIFLTEEHIKGFFVFVEFFHDANRSYIAFRAAVHGPAMMAFAIHGQWG